MNRQDAELLDAAFAAQLVSFEEALVSGQAPTDVGVTGDTAQSADFEDRLGRAKSLVQLLDRVWPPESRVQKGVGSRCAVHPLGCSGNDSRPLFEPCRFGRFEIVRELGRGGCGIVYLARDPVLGRFFALKLPRPEALWNSDLQRRFLREAEAAASLEHRNIVTVYEVEQVGAVTYIASAYCNGPTLAQWLKSQTQPVPVAVAADIVAQLANGVAHAHNRGVLHRDIKPSNVLLEMEVGGWGLGVGDRNLRKDNNLTHSEQTPNPQSLIPKLTDFGLAKLLEHTGDETRTGAVLGTTSYMAPEQAEGRTKDVGTHTDLYALGVVLYELLVGRPPFRGESDREVVLKISTTEPDSVRQLRPGVPRDLETICLKCLQKQPGDRYANAAELAADLRRFLADQPISARRTGPIELTWRWARRRPAAATLCLFAVLAIPGFLIGSSLIGQRIERTRAVGLVRSLLDADLATVPRVVRELEPLRTLVEPDLWRIVNHSPPESAERLRAALGLLPDESQAGYLADRALHTTSDEIQLIQSALGQRDSPLLELAATVLDEPSANPMRRLRAACVIAQAKSDSRHWDRIASEIAEWLLAEDEHSFVGLTRMLVPIREHMTDPLESLANDGARTLGTLRIGTALAELNAGDANVLVALLLRSDPVRFRVLFEKLLPIRDGAIGLLHDELVRAPESTASDGTLNRPIERHARTAIACFRLDDRRYVLDALRAAPDPSLRGTLIELLGPLGADPVQLAEAAIGADDPFVRSALLLAIGTCDLAATVDPANPIVIEALANLHTNDPDPGVHSAAEWALRQIKRDPPAASGGPPAGSALSRKRQWLVAHGHSMAMFVAPSEFDMGGPSTSSLPTKLSDGTRTSSPAPLRIRPAPFSIALKETTVAQFRRCRPNHVFDVRISPEPDCPINSVSFIEAAEYCNWLSREEGLEADQWCFVATTNEAGGPLVLAPDFLTRTGYRLPTEAEWEFACRAGTQTGRFFNETDAELKHYAWFLNNAKRRSWPVGLLRPNAFGLFDVYGNVTEWCINARGDSTPDRQCLRGNSMVYPPWHLTSFYRDLANVSFASNNVGFRIARRVPGTNSP